MNTRFSLLARTVGVLVLAGLLAGCSGLSLRKKPNPWDRICAHEKAYLQAVDQGDKTAEVAAVKLMGSDVSLFDEKDNMYSAIVGVAKAAQTGHPEPVRNLWEANCAPLPSAQPVPSTGPGYSPA